MLLPYTILLPSLWLYVVITTNLNQNNLQDQNNVNTTYSSPTKKKPLFNRTFLEKKNSCSYKHSLTFVPMNELFQAVSLHLDRCMEVKDNAWGTFFSSRNWSSDMRRCVQKGCTQQSCCLCSCLVSSTFMFLVKNLRTYPHQASGCRMVVQAETDIKFKF